MLITRKSDYAIRIVRALRDGHVHNVREICRDEDIPKAFAYKILREMEYKGLVSAERGNKGGYYMTVPADEMTLYDIVSMSEGEVSILHCMKEDCTRNMAESCRVHREIARIQDILETEMKRNPLSVILDD